MVQNGHTCILCRPLWLPGQLGAVSTAAQHPDTLFDSTSPAQEKTEPK